MGEDTSKSQGWEGEGPLSLWDSPCQYFSLSLLEGHIKAFSSFILYIMILGGISSASLVFQLPSHDKRCVFHSCVEKYCTKILGWKKKISTTRVKTNDHLSKGDNYPAKWDHLPWEGPVGLVGVGECPSFLPGTTYNFLMIWVIRFSLKYGLTLFSQSPVTMRWVRWRYFPEKPQGKSLFSKSDSIS